MTALIADNCPFATAGDRIEPYHITVEWNKNRNQLAQRMGVHTNYLDSKFYTMPFDLSLPPQCSILVHFGKRGDGDSPGYAVHRLLHRDVHPLHQVETCLGFSNVHAKDNFVLRAGTPLDKILENSQIQSFILLVSKEDRRPLTVWDFM